MLQVSQVTSYHMMSHDGSHDKCGKVVHRPCSSCISSIEKPNRNSIECKGDWSTRLQENPQLILQFAIMIQLTSRRILRDQDKAPKGMFYTIYWVCILSIRVSVIRAILVCLSITKVILGQAQAALEYRFAVQGWRQSYPLTSSSLC